MELNANLAVLFLVVVVCVLYCAVCGDSIKYQNDSDQKLSGWN